jgi:hypothetical protein
VSRDLPLHPLAGQLAQSVAMNYGPQDAQEHRHVTALQVREATGAQEAEERL